MRMEPPPSVPSAKGVTPAATEVAAPALEPPAVLDGAQARRADGGVRRAPPPPVPSARGVTPAATEVAAPALEPPVVFDGSQALRVTPESGLSPPPALHPNSVVVVLPITHAPAARASSTAGASSLTTLSAMAREPNVVLTTD